MSGKIKITFSTIPVDGETISFNDSIGGGKTYNLTFKTTKSNNTETLIASELTQTIYNALQSFNNNYNIGLLYKVSYTSDSLEIEGATLNTSFSNFSTTGSSIATLEANRSVTSDFVIIGTKGISHALDKCNRYNLEFTTSPFQADVMFSTLGTIPITTNPFNISLARGILFSASIRKNNLPSINVNQFVPILSSDKIQINTTNTGSSNTVEVVRTGDLTNANIQENSSFGLTFEYSLNGSSFSSTNTFIGAQNGVNTLKIKDSLGCQITKTFTISGIDLGNQNEKNIFEVSNVNSLRLKKDISFDDCTNPKTSENTLSYEEDTLINHKDFKHLFNKCDGVIKTQFKSNFTTHEAKLIDCNSVETILPIIKKTTNTNIVDIRDCRIGTKTASSNTLSFWLGGQSQNNTYDQVTGNISGSFDPFKDNFPVDIGDNVSIEGYGVAKIVSKSTINFGTFNRILFTTNITNTSIPFIMSNTTLVYSKISTSYSILEFERYEFSIDTSVLNGIYRIELIGTKDTTTCKFKSEYINIKEKHENTHLIEYFASENNEINYSTGIVNKIRLEYGAYPKFSNNSDNENYVTDTKTVQLDTTYRRLYEFDFFTVPTMIADKLIKALMHDNLSIDKQSYLLEDSPEVETLGNTNLINVKANLVKEDYVFDNNVSI